MHKVK